MGTVQHGAHSPRLERRISLDDWLADGELDRIAREREGANVKNTAFKPPCSCRECIGSDGQRHPVPVQHDCEYVAARSALVPEAERITNLIVGDGLNGDGYRWTATFNAAMDELVRQRGLLGTLDNGSAAHIGVQNVEMNGGPVSSGRSSIDATSAVIPMW